MTIDVKKVNIIREHVKSILEKNDSYIIYCKLNKIEIIELSKEFELEVISEINNNKKIKFKFKK